MRHSMLSGVVIILLAGCSALPKYVQPASGERAAVINSYSNLLLCKVNGPEGPGERHACRAFASEVDKHYAGFKESLRILPGEREVYLTCFFRAFGDEGVDGAFGDLVKLELAAGDSLTAVPYWDGPVCKVRLQDESGNDVPFERVSRPSAIGA